MWPAAVAAEGAAVRVHVAGRLHQLDVEGQGARLLRDDAAYARWHVDGAVGEEQDGRAIADGGVVDAGERDRHAHVQRRGRRVEIMSLHSKTIGRRDHGGDAVGVDERVVGAL